MQGNARGCKAIQGNAKECKAMQCDAMQCKTLAVRVNYKIIQGMVRAWCLLFGRSISINFICIKYSCCLPNTNSKRDLFIIKPVSNSPMSDDGKIHARRDVLTYSKVMSHPGDKSSIIVTRRVSSWLIVTHCDSLLLTAPSPQHATSLRSNVVFSP